MMKRIATIVVIVLALTTSIAQQRTITEFESSEEPLVLGSYFFPEAGKTCDHTRYTYWLTWGEGGWYYCNPATGLWVASAGGTIGPTGATGPTGDTGPAGPVAGNDTEVIFNDGDAPGADADFTYDKVDNTLATSNLVGIGYVYGQAVHVGDARVATRMLLANAGTGGDDLGAISLVSGSAISGSDVTFGGAMTFSGEVCDTADYFYKSDASGNMTCEETSGVAIGGESPQILWNASGVMSGVKNSEVNAHRMAANSMTGQVYFRADNNEGVAFSMAHRQSRWDDRCSLDTTIECTVDADCDNWCAHNTSITCTVDADCDGGASTCEDWGTCEYIDAASTASSRMQFGVNSRLADTCRWDSTISCTSDADCTSTGAGDCLIPGFCLDDSTTACLVDSDCVDDCFAFTEYSQWIAMGTTPPSGTLHSYQIVTTTGADVLHKAVGSFLFQTDWDRTLDESDGSNATTILELPDSSGDTNLKYGDFNIEEGSLSVSSTGSATFTLDGAGAATTIVSSPGNNYMNLAGLTIRPGTETNIISAGQDVSFWESNSESRLMSIGYVSTGGDMYDYGVWFGDKAESTNSITTPVEYVTGPVFQDGMDIRSDKGISLYMNHDEAGSSGSFSISESGNIIWFLSFNGSLLRSSPGGTISATSYNIAGSSILSTWVSSLDGGYFAVGENTSIAGIKLYDNGNAVFKGTATIGDNTDTDQYIYFDILSSSESLSWDESEDRFNFSDALNVAGSLHASTGSTFANYMFIDRDGARPTVSLRRATGSTEIGAFEADDTKIYLSDNSGDKFSVETSSPWNTWLKGTLQIGGTVCDTAGYFYRSDATGLVTCEEVTGTGGGTPGGTVNEIQFNNASSFDGVTGFLVSTDGSEAWGATGDIALDGPSGSGDLNIIEHDNAGSRLNFYNYPLGGYEWTAKFYGTGAWDVDGGGNKQLITSLNSQWYIHDTEETERPTGSLIRVRSTGNASIMQFDYDVSASSAQQMLRIIGSTGGPVLEGPVGDTDYNRPFYFRSLSKNSSNFGVVTPAFEFGSWQVTDPTDDLVHFSVNGTTVLCIGMDGQMYHGTTCGSESKAYAFADSTSITWTGTHAFTGNVGFYGVANFTNAEVIGLERSTPSAPADPGEATTYFDTDNSGQPSIIFYGGVEQTYQTNETATTPPDCVIGSSWQDDNDNYTLYRGVPTDLGACQWVEEFDPGPDTWSGSIGATGPTGATGPSGADGSGSNYTQAFTTQTSVSITHNLGTDNLVMDCYDTNDQHIQPDTYTIGASDPWNIAVTFFVAQTGRCVVNGSGGAGDRYVTVFSAQTAVTVTGATHGLAGSPLAISCYDDSDPRERVSPDDVTFDDANGDVVITFFAAETGKCVLQ